MADDEVPAPVAYCAPGREVIASLTLLARGERHSVLKPHPWLEGSTEIWLAAAPGWPLEPGMPPVTDCSVLVRMMQEAEEERWLRFMSPALRLPGAIIEGS